MAIEIAKRIFHLVPENHQKPPQKNKTLEIDTGTSNLLGQAYVAEVRGDTELAISKYLEMAERAKTVYQIETQLGSLTGERNDLRMRYGELALTGLINGNETDEAFDFAQTLLADNFLPQSSRERVLKELEIADINIPLK